MNVEVKTHLVTVVESSKLILSVMLDSCGTNNRQSWNRGGKSQGSLNRGSKSQGSLNMGSLKFRCERSSNSLDELGCGLVDKLGCQGQLVDKLSRCVVGNNSDGGRGCKQGWSLGKGDSLDG